MELVQVSKLQQGRGFVVANVRARNRLGKLAEEIDIPWKELNKVAREVVGREFGDCSKLSEGENRKVCLYLEANRRVLSERYRKIRWGQKQ